MVDEETRQILRELLAAQKEQTELARQMNEKYEIELRAYRDSLASYERQFAHWSSGKIIASTIRAAAFLGIAAVLAYLVVFGVHIR